MKIKILLIILMIAFLVGFVLGIILDRLIINADFDDTNNINKTYINISFIGLNEKEIKKISKIMDKVKDEYLSAQKGIKFVKEMNESDMDEENIVGLNINNGMSIKIEYTKNLNYLRKRICHELLHSFFYNDDEKEEYIIDDLEEYYPCFKK